MSVVTISLSDSIAATLESRARAAGFPSKEEYLLALVRADCEQTELESLLETRLNGPFASLGSEWKQEVRAAAKRRG
ncbi:MAG: ribbon-helix-helix protein, CopG family [Chthoniobacterales bacterium]|nr:ribbon-helix-helix protein, CopG family [Chthoniobacterales bacterium]